MDAIKYLKCAYEDDLIDAQTLAVIMCDAVEIAANGLDALAYVKQQVAIACM